MSYGAPVNLKRRTTLRRSLYLSLCHATQLVEAASSMYNADNYVMTTKLLGHSFSEHAACRVAGDVTAKSVMNIFGTWLRAHEEAQVMVGSVLVVFGIWWLVRTLLSLVANLVCPLILVLMAVVCVPQLRQPLLGQNYPVVAKLLRRILLKMAENLKSEE